MAATRGSAFELSKDWCRINRPFRLFLNVPWGLIQFSLWWGYWSRRVGPYSACAGSLRRVARSTRQLRHRHLRNLLSQFLGRNQFWAWPQNYRQACQSEKNQKNDDGIFAHSRIGT